MNHEAIYKTHPTVVYINGDDENFIAYDKDNNKVDIDLAAVNAWQDPNAYKYARVREYPPIGDQLDALFHAGVFPPEMASKIQAVKDKYPKVN